MVFFLAVVSVVFILGGGAGALYGADMIRTETGGTIALSGVAVICAGFLLLALVLVLVELRRIRDRLDASPAAVPVPPPAIVAPPAPAVAPPLATETENPAVATPTRSAEPRQEPAAEQPSPIPTPPAPQPSKPQVVVETIPDRQARKEPPPLVPPPPPLPRVPPPAAEAGGPLSDDLLADEEESETGHARADDEPPRRSSPEETGRKESAAPEVPKGPRTPVATYNSGANTYFMYADGTIEAETARGRFRFASMAELRHYAETGEGGVRIDEGETA